LDPAFDRFPDAFGFVFRFFPRFFRFDFSFMFSQGGHRTTAGFKSTTKADQRLESTCL